MQKKLINKGVIAFILFQIIYSFSFGMIFGDKNPFVFLYNQGYLGLYMIISPIFASLFYIGCGYLITLARNDHRNLEEKNLNLSAAIIVFYLLIYILTYLLQLLFPFRNLFSTYIFLNYPSSAFLNIMDLSEYTSNLIVSLTALLPGVMVYIGGKLRLKSFKQEVINGQDS